MNKFNSLKERIKKNFKENKVLLFVLLAIWVATVIITLIGYGNTLGKQSIGNEGSQEVVELDKNTKIIQTLNVDDLQDTESICLKFATYARTGNKGNIYINVVGENSKTEYVNETIDISKLVDNDFVTISLNKKLYLSNDSNIKVTITSDSEKDKSAGIYYSSNDVFDKGNLIINNKTMDGDLSVRFLLENKELSTFYKIVITFTLISFTIILIMILLVNPKIEIIFTMMAAVFGLIFWIIITPMSVPDETIHYEYSFQLSNIMMGEEDYRYFDEEYQNYGSFAGHYNISAAYSRLVKKINNPLVLDNKKVEMRFDVKESYVTAFIPQAIGITLSRLLNFNMLKTFYIGRLFNLIFYVTCVYIAVKNTPIHKVLFGSLATMPMFIQQAASFSYDCEINGLSLVLIAFTLKWMFQKEKIDIKEIVFVFIVNCFLAPLKVVYALFSLLLLFVPKENYGSMKKKTFYTLLVMSPAIYELVILIFPLIGRVIKKIFKNIVYADIGESTIDQAHYYSEDEVYSFSDVMNNPLQALEIFVRTIRYSIKNWFYGAFGRTLSGNTLVVPITIVHAMMVIVLAMVFREEQYIESSSFKIVSVILCVIAGLMMLGGMLITWTPITQDIIDAYGGPIIQGVQGRYFCPLLPYFLLIFNNKKIKINQKFDKYLLFAYILLVFEVIVYVLSYTFVN